MSAGPPDRFISQDLFLERYFQTPKLCGVEAAANFCADA
jgi:hypothetical protein